MVHVASQKKADAEADRDQLKKEILELSSSIYASKQQRLAVFDETSRRFAKKLVRIGLVIGFIVLILFSVMAESFTNFEIHWFAGAAVVVISGLGVAGTFFGGSVKEWVQPIERRIRQNRRKTMLERYAPDIDLLEPLPSKEVE